MALETFDSLADDLKPMVLLIVAQNTSLLGRLDDLLAQNKSLLARIAELEAKLGAPPKTPDNSSLPPSKGQKTNLPDAVPKKKGRKGRAGVTRVLCANPDVTRDIYAKKCRCGAKLSEADQPGVFAYDHVDLPPIKPVTTRIHLHACQFVSYNRLVEMLGGLFGVTLSEGAIANMLARARVPFAARAAEIATVVRNSPVIASDETSARVMGKTFWQWVFSTTTAVYHVIAPSRGKCVPTTFLGEAKPDVWLSDRYAGQGKLADAHQYCLAHLLREAQYAIDAGDTIFAPAFKAFLKDACAVGRRRPELADITIKGHARRLQRELDCVLDLEPRQADGRHLRDAMSVTARDKLLVFLTRRDIEPTNNESERALRPSVIFRKVTNGFRSVWGAEVYADICSVVATGKRNGQPALAAIRDALNRRVAA